jgi:hypothetical protein
MRILLMSPALIVACGVQPQGPASSEGTRAVGEATEASCTETTGRAWCEGSTTLRWCQNGRVFEQRARPGDACFDLVIGAVILPLVPEEGHIMDCGNPCDHAFLSEHPGGLCDSGRLLYCEDGRACAAVCAVGTSCRWDRQRYDCVLDEPPPPSADSDCCGFGGVCGCNSETGLALCCDGQPSVCACPW